MVVHPSLEYGSHGETTSRQFKTVEDARRYIRNLNLDTKDVRLYKELLP